MKVTPLHIEIALHYCTRPNDFPRAEAPSVTQALDEFVNAGLLRRPTASNRNPCVYERSTGLEMWVDALCKVPWPRREWTMSEQTETVKTGQTYFGDGCLIANDGPVRVEPARAENYEVIGAAREFENVGAIPTFEEMGMFIR